MTPEKTVERLSLYRRLLQKDLSEGETNIFSHELAGRTGGTAAQVRRDLMVLGFSGGSRRGYSISGLIGRIGEFLDSPDGEPVALVGVGNLGRALLPFFAAYRPNLKVVAAFDTDPLKTGRVIHGCRCHLVDELETVIRARGIRVAIIAVPAGQAQRVADRLAQAGVRGILNFVPVPLHVPQTVAVEAIDITTALEKVAFLARQKEKQEETEA